jgi:hypothetical protein
VDGGVAEPVGGAQPGEGIDRFAEDGESVVADGGRGQLAGAGEQPGSAEGRPPSKRGAGRMMGRAALTDGGG